MLRILAVDDNKMHLKLIKTNLGTEGMEIHLAQNAAEALDAIKEREFDLILTDLNMPGMDGIELAMMIRDISPDLPIVLITACPTSNSSELAKAVGIKNVLDKSISPIELVSIVKEEAIKWKTYKNSFSLKQLIQSIHT